MSILCKILTHKWREFTKADDIFTYRSCMRCGFNEVMLLGGWRGLSDNKVSELITAANEHHITSKKYISTMYEVKDIIHDMSVVCSDFLDDWKEISKDGKTREVDPKEGH